MITQQELTDKCIPEIIKKMVELAEGFEIVDERYINFGKDITCASMHIFTWPLFSTLIHRAVEGCSHIIVDYESKHVEETTMCKLYNFKDYQPTTLTHAGCAMLDCLLEVLK